MVSMPFRPVVFSDWRLFLYQLNYYGSWLLPCFSFFLYFHKAEPLSVSLVVTKCDKSPVSFCPSFPACVSPATCIVPFWAHIPWQGLPPSVGSVRLCWHLQSPKSAYFVFCIQWKETQKNRRNFCLILGYTYHKVSFLGKGRKFVNWMFLCYWVPVIW